MARIRKRLTTVGLAVAATIGLSACATNAPVATHQPANEPTLKALSAAANNVSHQLELLNSANHSQQKAHIYPIPHSGVMAQPITLTWSGPIGPAVQSVAKLLGFKFETAGLPPASPRIISVHAQHEPAFAVLQNIGWQAGSQVGIVVRPRRQLVMLAYQGYKQQHKGGKQ